MGTADDFLDRYAALPSAERNSAGVRPPSASLRLSVLYRPSWRPSSSMKRAGVQFDQSLPCQNSFLSRPKKPSIAALSGLQPLADWIGYTDVDSSGGRKRREDRVRVPARGPRGGAAWVRRLSTRSTSLMTGSYSISTSRMMPKRSPVRKCWVRVLWTMFQYAGIELASRNHTVPVTQQQIDKNTIAHSERAAKGAIVDATRTARGATVL